jgi:adenosylcobinamide-GDP ribazoletransferase
MLKEWRYLLLAVGFFTRIPVPQFGDFKTEELNHAAKYFPLVGVLIGLVGALLFFAANLVFPQSIAVLISMASTIWLTGAFHEDGLADSMDGLGGAFEREQALTIMQDSRLGTYGAIALFFALFGKFQLLSHMHPAFVPLVLVAAHALSRLAAVWVMATADYVKPNGKARPLATQITGGHLATANLFGLLPMLLILVLLAAFRHSPWVIAKLVLMVLLPMLLAWVWWRAKLLKRLGGYTGDTLGATQQITELVFYLGVLAWSAGL